MEEGCWKFFRFKMSFARSTPCQPNIQQTSHTPSTRSLNGYFSTRLSLEGYQLAGVHTEL
jgi:hypothetical protein